jgi:hypothetical protein
MDAERDFKTNDESARFEQDGRERAEDALHAQIDMTNQDLEDLDERQDQDQPDGRPSPMANADNAER